MIAISGVDSEKELSSDADVNATGVSGLISDVGLVDSIISLEGVASSPDEQAVNITTANRQIARKCFLMFFCITLFYTDYCGKVAS